MEQAGGNPGLHPGGEPGAEVQGKNPEPHPGAENAGGAEAETTRVGEALLHWKETGK